MIQRTLQSLPLLSKRNQERLKDSPIGFPRIRHPSAQFSSGRGGGKLFVQKRDVVTE